MGHMGILQGMYSVLDHLVYNRIVFPKIKDKRIKQLDNASCHIFLCKFCVKFNHKINFYNKEYMQGKIALKLQQNNPFGLFDL